MPDTEISPLARALGRVASGLFVVSADDGSGPVGFVGSFVVQVGLEPPTVCVAVGRNRGPLEAIKKSGRFGVSILGEGDQGLMKPFFKRYDDGAGPFDAVKHERAPEGSPVLEEALGWLECRVSGEHETGDHVVVFGEVTAGDLRREGQPATHVRKNGLGY